MLCVLIVLMMIYKGIAQGSGFSFTSFVGIDVFSSDPFTDFEQLNTDDVLSDLRSPYQIGIEVGYYIERSSLKYCASYRLAYRTLSASINHGSQNNNVGFNQHTISLGLIYGTKFSKDMNKGVDFAFDFGIAGHTVREALFSKYEVIDGDISTYNINLLTVSVLPVFSLSCKYVHNIFSGQKLFIGVGLLGQPFNGHELVSDLRIISQDDSPELNMSSGARFSMWTPIFIAGIYF